MHATNSHRLVLVVADTVLDHVFLTTVIWNGSKEIRRRAMSYLAAHGPRTSTAPSPLSNDCLVSVLEFELVQVRG